MKVFDGNTNMDSVVFHQVDPPIIARVIRFRPIAWKDHISMRVELYGCKGNVYFMNQHCLIMHRPARKSIVFILPLQSYYTGKTLSFAFYSISLCIRF